MTWGRHAWMKRQLPMRLTSSCSASTSGSRWRRAPAVAMPALAIATSIPPQRSTMSATAPATAAPPVTTATGRATGGGRLLAAGAPAGDVGLVLGALAHHLGDGECDEALHEHREDDEEHEDQPERGGEGAQGDDHDAAER